MLENVQYIQTDDALADFCNAQQNAPWLACDTEFIRESSYYPDLCLIQLATPHATALIDPFCVTDFSPLTALWLNPAITKVFHAASQDLEIIWQRFAIVPTPIFDTQLAALAMELGDQISYAQLVKHFTAVELDKSAARTNWRQRPLSAEQCRYAADDVRYLGTVYRQSLTTLGTMGRAHWLRDDFAALSDPQLHQPSLDRAWLKVRGARKLSPLQQTALQQLAAWRESAAMGKNCPRRWLLADDGLIELARRLPQSRKQLRTLKTIAEQQAHQYGDQWLVLIEKILALPSDQWVKGDRIADLTQEQQDLVEYGLEWTKNWAKTVNFRVTAVAHQEEMIAFVLDESDCALRRGWRGAWVAPLLVDALRQAVEPNTYNAGK